MGPESYRHRFEDGEFKLTHGWYLDQNEVDQLCESAEKGELSYDVVNSLLDHVSNLVSNMRLRHGGNIPSGRLHELDQMEQTVNKLRPIRNKLMVDHSSDIIDLTEQSHNN